jgi:hypothetical protein
LVCIFVLQYYPDEQDRAAVFTRVILVSNCMGTVVVHHFAMEKILAVVQLQLVYLRHQIQT